MILAETKLILVLNGHNRRLVSATVPPYRDRWSARLAASVVYRLERPSISNKRTVGWIRTPSAQSPLLATFLKSEEYAMASGEPWIASPATPDRRP
jgi:hypothetical protein